MIEELKILAQVLEKVTDGAVNGVIAYLVFSYLKPVTLCGVVSYTVIKVSKLFFNRTKEPVNVIQVED